MCLRVPFPSFKWKRQVLVWIGSIVSQGCQYTCLFSHRQNMLCLALTENPHKAGPLEFCAHRSPQTLHANAAAREVDIRFVRSPLPTHMLHCPIKLSSQNTSSKIKLVGISKEQQQSIKLNAAPFWSQALQVAHSWPSPAIVLWLWAKVLVSSLSSLMSTYLINEIKFARPRGKKQDMCTLNSTQKERTNLPNKGANCNNLIFTWCKCYRRDYFTRILLYNLWIKPVVKERLGSSKKGKFTHWLFQMQFLRLIGTLIGESLNVKVQSYIYQWSVFLLVDKTEQFQESCCML